MSVPFPVPETGTVLSAADGDARHARFLSERRSTPAKLFDPDGPAPSGDELESILTAAARVPDHRKLEPWRFIILQGDARTRLGDVLAARWQALNPDAPAAALDEERARPFRAPLTVSVVSAPDHGHKTPVWEQELSAGALCLNLLLCARAAGYAGSWVTEWWAYDEEVDRALGLNEGERIAGHILIGTARENPVERPRPDITAKVHHWQG